jgi:hypothetical protein
MQSSLMICSCRSDQSVPAAAREAQEAANADQPKPETAVPERLASVVVIMPDRQLQCGLRVEEGDGYMTQEAAAAAGKRRGPVIELTAVASSGGREPPQASS